MIEKQINQKQINQKQIKCNNCMISSFIFVTNIIVAYYYKYYVYGSLFAALIISSLVFHSNPQYIYTNLIDKIIILAIFIYGGYIFIRLINFGWLIKEKYFIDNFFWNVFVTTQNFS